MEMLDGNRRLVRGMEEDGCRCGGEAGLRQRNTFGRLLRQKETRLQRMAPFLAAALLLLASVALALLTVVALGGRGHQSPGSQVRAVDCAVRLYTASLLNYREATRRQFSALGDAGTPYGVYLKGSAFTSCCTVC